MALSRLRRPAWGHPQADQRLCPKHSNTKHHATGAERAHIARLLDPARPLPGKEIPTFGEFVEKQWWPTYPKGAGNRKTTIREKEIHLRLHLDSLKPMRLDEIRGPVFLKLFADLREKGLGEKSVANVRATLRKILVCAHEWDVLPNMPPLPRVKITDSGFDFLNKQEANQLVAAARTPEERALFLFSLHTGARAGEQRAIGWGDLDWANRYVMIRKSLPCHADEIGPTKSGKERKVPMTDTLHDALKAMRDLRHLKGGLVFCTGSGTPLSMWQLHDRLWSGCRRAGLREIRWHDMRHSFASNLVSSGVPIRQVQEWLGHSTMTMTMRYAHLAPGSGDEIRVLDGPSQPKCPDDESSRHVSQKSAKDRPLNLKLA